MNISIDQKQDTNLNTNLQRSNVRGFFKRELFEDEIK